MFPLVADLVACMANGHCGFTPDVLCSAVCCGWVCVYHGEGNFLNINAPLSS